MPYVIGIDEVGRGCLAGDVYVAAFMADTTMAPVAGVADSKVLSPAKREEVAKRLVNTPDTFWKVAIRPVSTIDRLGIDKAVWECFREAALGLLGLGHPVDLVRIDGRPPNSSFWHGLNGAKTEFVVDGDATDWRIGAASILAKVSRDAYMVEMAKQHPGYGWERNAGYGTKEHIAAIKKRGMTPLHRKKFCRNFSGGSNPVEEPSDGILSLF